MSKFILNNQYIEICEMPEEELAGRSKIKMSALEIVPDNSSYNDNGITWLREYIDANIKSAIGMPYVVSWLDEENQIPSDHGIMNFDDEGNVVFDGVTVGTVLDAYIEDIEIDGETKTLLMTEGFIYRQRYPKFVDWLKTEIENGKIYGSIEINGKGESKIIEYLDGSTNSDGTKKMGRIPTEFDFSGLAILYLTDPADKNSIVFEVNSKEGENKNMDIVNKGVTIEMNKLNYYDICTLITRAFNKAMGCDDCYCCDYDIYRFYPIESQVIFNKWREVGIYYSTTYKIENSAVTIGEIIKVQEDWTPTADSQPVEININQIKKIIAEQNQKGGTEVMNVEELNAKIAELSSQLTELNNKVTELNSVNVEKDNKIAELNEALVTANKSLEEVNAKYSTLEVETNEYKENLNKIETEKKKAEVNSYFEVEIPKNKFDEVEVNSLKEYVEKCDLEGLKKAEADLIVKRFKEGKLTGIETNSTKEENNIFFHTKEEKMDENLVDAGKALFV